MGKRSEHVILYLFFRKKHFTCVVYYICFTLHMFKKDEVMLKYESVWSGQIVLMSRQRREQAWKQAAGGVGGGIILCLVP